MTMKWQKDTEYLKLIQDLIEHEDVKNLEKFVHHKVTNRLAHSIFRKRYYFKTYGRYNPRYS